MFTIQYEDTCSVTAMQLKYLSNDMKFLGMHYCTPKHAFYDRGISSKQPCVVQQNILQLWGAHMGHGFLAHTKLAALHSIAIAIHSFQWLENAFCSPMVMRKQ